MASFEVQPSKIKRLQSRNRSHSWWWDSHISPKNSRWLAENLEDMDRSVRRMLKLIEEDGDSLAKKAEMYYQKRPELIALVEEFYRMYRSLAERYDHVTGELRKNIQSDTQSQGSAASDIASETSSLAPAPEQKQSHRRSTHRAAGFDYFLGLDFLREDETSTLTDSETESDHSSVHNVANGGEHTLNAKITELESNLREMKERLQEENSDELLSRISEYEQDLKNANKQIQDSEEEVARMKADLEKYKSIAENGCDHIEEKPESDSTHKAPNIDGLETLTEESKPKIAGELEITKEKLRNAENEIVSLKHQLQSDKRISSLQEQLELAHKDWETKLNAEKREVSKLQERVSRLKTSLSDRDHEVRDLKIAVSDAEEKIFPKKAQIKAEMSKLSDERSRLEGKLRESESSNRSLEDQIRILQTEKSETEERQSLNIKQLTEEIAERNNLIVNLNKSIDGLKLEREEMNRKVASDINQMEKHLQELHMEHVELISARELVEKLRLKANELEEEVERQRIVIHQGAEEKREAIRQLCFSIEHYKDGYQRLRDAFIGHRRVPVFGV